MESTSVTKVVRDRFADIKLDESTLHEWEQAKDAINKVHQLLRTAADTLIFNVKAPMSYSPCATSVGLVLYFRIPPGMLLSAACQCNGDVLVEYADKKESFTPTKAVAFINQLFDDMTSELD